MKLTKHDTECGQCDSAQTQDKQTKPDVGVVSATQKQDQVSNYCIHLFLLGFTVELNKEAGIECGTRPQSHLKSHIAYRHRDIHKKSPRIETCCGTWVRNHVGATLSSGLFSPDTWDMSGITRGEVITCPSPTTTRRQEGVHKPHNSLQGQQVPVLRDSLIGENYCTCTIATAISWFDVMSE